jgi:carbamoylphosphate synthase small subunit
MIHLAFLYLEDGSIIAGKGFGARGIALGKSMSIYKSTENLSMLD